MVAAAVIGQTSGSKPSEQPDCAALSSDLRQLLRAPDRERFSTEHAIYYADDKVRVIVTLAHADAPLPQLPRLSEEARFNEFVQALVPLGALCDLSSDPAVRWVESPVAPDLTDAVD